MAEEEDMEQRVADLIRKVLDLDRAGREEIIEAVLVSLDESGFDPDWLEEAHRRFDAIRTGGTRA